MQRKIDLELALSNEYGEKEVRADENFRFKCIYECRKSPTCCRGGNTQLIQTDFYDLAKHFNLSNEDFFQRYCRLSYQEALTKPYSWYFMMLKEGKDGYCVLLDTSRLTKRCSVYKKVKPLVCRVFPMGFKGEVYTVSLCPGVGKGDLHAVQEWIKENKTVEFKNALQSIVIDQQNPFLDEFGHLLRLIERKKKRRAEELKHEIKIGQQKIIMEMFGIKIL